LNLFRILIRGIKVFEGWVYMSSVETMKLWPVVVKDDESVPEVFRDVYATAVGKRESMPYAVFTPEFASDEGRIHCNPQMIVLVEDRIIIFESTGYTVQITSFSIDNIYYIEQGAILLNAWIAITGVVNSKESTYRINYNASGDRILDPIVQGIRLEMIKKSNSNTSQETPTSTLNKLNSRLNNYIVQNLLSNQKIIACVDQTEISVQSQSFFSRNALESHVIVLTDSEIIIIQENIFEKPIDNNYGGVQVYIPLSKITKMSADYDAAMNRIKFIIELSEDNKLELVCVQTHKDELEGIITYFVKNFR
jgi:hypothetical protein